MSEIEIRRWALEQAFQRVSTTLEIMDAAAPLRAAARYVDWMLTGSLPAVAEVEDGKAVPLSIDGHGDLMDEPQDVGAVQVGNVLLLHRHDKVDVLHDEALSRNGSRSHIESSVGCVASPNVREGGRVGNDPAAGDVA